MIDWEFQWHSTPPERFQAVSIALLAIASFIVHDPDRAERRLANA
jgi:hypothetical protein